MGFDTNDITSSKTHFWTKIFAHSIIVIDSDLLHVDSKRLIKGEQHC